MNKQNPIVGLSRRQSPDKAVPTWSLQERRSTRRQDQILESAFAQSIPIEDDAFNILILNYTMTCPLACDYCCYSCGPRRAETMDLDFALSIVNQAAELGVFKEFGFTGGEPLVYQEDILQLTRRMHELEMPFSMISSCFWATDDEAVNLTLKPLVENGMSVFTISHDPSHECWVPRDFATRAGKFILEEGVRLVICGSFYDESNDLRDIFPEFKDCSNVSFVTRVVLPTQGRAERKGVTPSFYPNANLTNNHTCYKRIYHDVTVFWDGEVYPCCSVYNRDTPSLSFGNLYNEPLAQIWDRIESSQFLKIIKLAGFDKLQQELLENYPELELEIPPKSEMIGPCHRCFQYLSNQKVRDSIKELYAQREQDQVKEFLSRIVELAGEDFTVRMLRNLLDESKV